MSSELEGASERLAGLIVGSLHDAGVVDAANMPRATSIAAEEITVTKSMGDYWCSWCGSLVSPGGGPGTARSRGRRRGFGVKSARWPPVTLRRRGESLERVSQVSNLQCRIGLLGRPRNVAGPGGETLCIITAVPLRWYDCETSA
jgi:hypothetical protein